MSTTEPKAMLLMAIDSPELAGLAIRAGFAAVILDLEHGFPLGGNVRDIITACEAAGGECLVRLPRSMLDRVGPLADCGVAGFVLSLVRSEEEMCELADRALFPPSGSRSINPFVVASGAPGDAHHLARSANKLRLWAMGETREFADVLANSSEDDRSPYDGVLIGPYDLSADLDVSLDPSNSELNQTVRLFAEWAERFGKTWALFVRDLPSLEAWHSSGIRPPVVVLGSDRDIWFQECYARIDGANRRRWDK